jgi:hypothetical protein
MANTSVFRNETQKNGVLRDLDVVAHTDKGLKRLDAVPIEERIDDRRDQRPKREAHVQNEKGQQKESYPEASPFTSTAAGRARPQSQQTGYAL